MQIQLFSFNGNFMKFKEIEIITVATSQENAIERKYVFPIDVRSWYERVVIG